jgi:hypothetical protein
MPGPEVCMLKATRSELDARAISSVAMAKASQPIPVPPYSSGMIAPNRPISPILSTMSFGQ